ncbi:MAG: hypothetical protein R8K53_08465 [Mariprofundaceae bacterium]
MKKIIALLFSTCAISALSSTVSIAASTEKTGLVNFNVNSPPVSTQKRQPIQAFGCNTSQDAAVSWGMENQLMALPYGKHTSTSGKEYHVSKYYLASPPIPDPTPQGQPTNIGLLTPDKFRFTGKQPAHIVNLDYSILEAVYLQTVKANFKYNPKKRDQDKIQNTKKAKKGPSCKKLGIDFVPINVVCPNFPWKNGSMGASGIGFLDNSKGKAWFFMSTQDAKGQHPLQCSVTILDDILLDHEVYFATTNGPSKTVDLTYLYESGKEMEMICHLRDEDDVPPGCQSE